MKIFLITTFCSLLLICCQQEKQVPVVPGMQNLFLLSDAKTRSISPENITGEKGQGSRTELEDGNAKKAAQKLGKGWKVNPYLFIQPGETAVLAEADGPGIINHIWLTPARDREDRLRILRFYWDDEEYPSVEVPLGDFFCNAWDHENQSNINSFPVSVNPLNGFNSFWQMPFRKKFKITLENKADTRTRIFYQVDYTLTDVPENAAYFHAQFRRNNPVKFKDPYVIVDNIKGKGHYVGTFLAHGTNDKGWWGEGEIKFYMDGDTDYPTINGTGEEDYFLGSWGYAKINDDGSTQYSDYHTPFAGFFQVKNAGPNVARFGQYR